MPRVLVVYGPNLNLLGEREPQIYGRETLEAISDRLSVVARREGVDVEFFQSNSEGALIDRLQRVRKTIAAVVLNAGALSHYSHALRDAIASIEIPVIEVHMTNVLARGGFRASLVLAPACHGVIVGFGANSFVLGLRAAIDLVRQPAAVPGAPPPAPEIPAPPSTPTPALAPAPAAAKGKPPARKPAEVRPPRARPRQAARPEGRRPRPRPPALPRARSRGAKKIRRR